MDKQNQAQETRPQFGMFLMKVTGGITLAFGIGLLALFIWFSFKLSALNRLPELGALIFLGVLVPIILFCLTVGSRLLLNRPNRYGSLFAPFVWRSLGIVFGIAAVSLAAMSVAYAMYTQLPAALFAALLSGWCFKDWGKWGYQVLIYQL
jgi:cobalamin synthase